MTDPNYIQLDITDKEAVLRAIEEIRPDCIVRFAAWTAVDAAEDEENKETVDAINHYGTQYIAEVAWYQGNIRFEKLPDLRIGFNSSQVYLSINGRQSWCAIIHRDFCY